MSRPKPTNISFAISSGLLGSIDLVFFNGLNDDPSDYKDGGAIINREGCTTFNGFGSVTFGVFLLAFLVEVLAFRVFMGGKESEEEDVLKNVNESDGLMGFSE